MQNLVNKYRIIFHGKSRQISKLPKKITILELPKNLFWSLAKAQIESSELLKVGARFKNAKFGWRNHFSGKPKQTLKPMFKFPINFFEVCQKPKSNLLSHWILLQRFKIPNLLDEFKTIFLGKRCWLWIYQKLSSHIGIPYKLVLESVKSLNQIFWEIKCSPMNLVDEYKTIFLGQRDKHFFKTFLLVLEFYEHLFGSLSKA